MDELEQLQAEHEALCRMWEKDYVAMRQDRDEWKAAALQAEAEIERLRTKLAAAGAGGGG